MAFALGWSWGCNGCTSYNAGRSPEDVSRLAALVELTATEVFDAYGITEVRVAPCDHYR